MRNLRQYLRAIMGIAIIAVMLYLSVITGARVLLGAGVLTTATHYPVEAYMIDAIGDHHAFSVTKKNTQILQVNMESAVSDLTISTSIADKTGVSKLLKKFSAKLFHPEPLSSGLVA